jgi:DNA repair protein RadC
MKYEILSERNAPSVRITAPSEVFPYVKRYAKKRQEHFISVSLTASQEILKIRILTIGLLNRVIIAPREVFAPALEDRACSLILCHNHPSGALNPSREDREATERMVKAGVLMGIPILDHLIIGRSGFYSFRENGEML